jgi:hypothetical protein
MTKLYHGDAQLKAEIRYLKKEAKKKKNCTKPEEERSDRYFDPTDIFIRAVLVQMVIQTVEEIKQEKERIC